MRPWISYAVCVAAAVVSAIPAEAACCCSNRLFTSGYSYVLTEGCEAWDCGQGDEGNTEDMTGVFWILGDGDPRFGPGIDNGQFEVDGDPGSGRGWLYVYPGYAAVISSTWCASVFIDGQPDFAEQPRRCMALVLEDHVPGTGASALAVLSDAPDNLGNYWFENDGDFVLRPMPPPRILGSQRNSSGEVSRAREGTRQVEAPDQGPVPTRSHAIGSGTERVYSRVGRQTSRVTPSVRAAKLRVT